MNLLQFNTCTRKQRGKSLCDKSKAKKEMLWSHTCSSKEGGGGDEGVHVIDQHAESGTKKQTWKQSQEHKHIPQGATLAPPKYKCATKKNMHKQNYELRKKRKTCQ